MAAEFAFVCPLSGGLHARPASVLAELASRFAADCTLFNKRKESTANVKSVLAIIAADVRWQDECEIRVTGADEAQACLALRGCIERELPASELDAAPPAAVGKAQVPMSLQVAGATGVPGISVCPGIGQGKVVTISSLTLPVELGERGSAEAQDSHERLERALAQVRGKLEGLIRAARTSAEETILRAHLAIARDPALLEKLTEAVARGCSAGQAVVEAGRFFEKQFAAAASHYVHERVADVVDVCLRLLEELYGASFKPATPVLSEPSVVIAETLTPQQLLALDRSWLEGVIFESAATTSHAAILARSLAVPTLAGVQNAARQFLHAGSVVVDANRGLAFAQTPAVRSFYDHETELVSRRNEFLLKSGRGAAITSDGRMLTVAANIASLAELQRAIAVGADGIGLLRTEMLFAASDALLSEDEQFAIYAEAARASPGGVIIRSLDIGGDKPLPQIDLPHEANPFLGYRGVRIYREHRQIFQTQLRAILRASAQGPVQLMVPMISSVDEVKWVRSELEQARAELAAQQTAFDPAMPFGIMLEVPAACLIVKQLCEHVDFFSVGSNDLTQYFAAADRNNPAVSALADALHPGFLRLLQQCVAQIHAAGKWVGICGEMAADELNLPLMIGLGVDEISVAPPAIPLLKSRIGRWNATSCQRVLARAMDCSGASEVRELLVAERAAARNIPLLEPSMILLDAKCQTKQETIRALSEALFITGRTEDPDLVEQALWAREATYPTALGNGFAVPHCKSDAVTADSIGVLRLARPIVWSEADQSAVQVVIVLAMRKSHAEDRHMQVFSKLARKLMNQEFRERLLQASDPDRTAKELAVELNTDG